MPRLKPPPALLGSPDDIENQFYEALQQGDIDKLMAIWSDDDDIACVHPGGPRLIGAAAIRASFETMFANGAINAFPEKVRRVVSHSSAVHNVLERVQVMSQEGPQSAWVIATNVYLKGAQGWRLVAHHASPGTAREVQEIVETASTLH
jgi:ketosteroid isomerase-like protein